MITKGINWGVVGYLCELCALTLWVGGLVVIIAVVIPAVFNSLGMEPAGHFLRRVFDGYGLMNVGILVLLAALAWFRHRTFGTNSHHLFSVSSMEWGLLAGMVLVTFSILGVLGPQAVAFQEQAFEAFSKEEKEIAYENFFRLHMVIRALHFVNLGLAVALFIGKLRKVLFHHGSALASDGGPVCGHGGMIKERQ